MASLILALAVPVSGTIVLEIDAPPELSAEAARVEALQPVEMAPFLDLIGLESPGAPVRILLVAEGSVLAERVPPWIAGLADGADDLVVLFPHRVPAYPYSSLAELVRHELAHVLIDRACGGASLPRWFHEGLAMTAEGSWRMTDRSRLAMAMLRAGEPTAEELSALFGGGEHRIAWAYAVSGALVRDLLRRHGRSAMRDLLSETARGVDFDTAFSTVYEATPAESLATFWRRSALWYRWLPFVTSSTVLWIAVTLLALLAIRRRRERDRRLHAAWEAEEAALSAREQSSDVEETVH